LVVTQPDRPAGRGQQLRPTPVKVVARELGIPTIEPQRLRREAVSELFAEPSDFFVVASYGKIVPQSLLDLPRFGALNVHPSLLPLYRGATPLQTQIRDGVAESGVTIIMMDAGTDTGDIVLQECSAIGERETYGQLHDRFADLGAGLLRQAIEAARGGKPPRVPQASLMREERASETLTKPIGKADLRIEGRSDLTMRAIVDHVRSLAPEPGARVDVASFGPTKVLAAHALAQGPPVDILPGHTLAIEGSILIRASDGWAVVDALVPPGKREMTREQCRRGYPFTSKEPYEKKLRTWYQENPGILDDRKTSVKA
jgi:methionyl-tRNA formyltransferase